MNLDDYRGRLLARAFHDELEKLSFSLTSAVSPPIAVAAKAAKATFTAPLSARVPPPIRAAGTVASAQAANIAKVAPYAQKAVAQAGKQIGKAGTKIKGMM
jgi:hypothetical protein